MHVACIHVIIRLFVKRSFIIVGFHRSRVCARGRWMAQRGAYTEAQAVMFYIHNACMHIRIGIHLKMCMTVMAVCQKLLSESNEPHAVTS